MDDFDGLRFKEHRKGIGRPWSQMGRKNFLDLDYGDDFSILDESVSNINEPLETMRVQGS